MRLPLESAPSLTKPTKNGVASCPFWSMCPSSRNNHPHVALEAGRKLLLALFPMSGVPNPALFACRGIRSTFLVTTGALRAWPGAAGGRVRYAGSPEITFPFCFPRKVSVMPSLRERCAPCAEQPEGVATRASIHSSSSPVYVSLTTGKRVAGEVMNCRCSGEP